MDDDDLTMGPWIDYAHARIEYRRCLGPGCPSRFRDGDDRPCSEECRVAWQVKSMRQAAAA